MHRSCVERTAIDEERLRRTALMDARLCLALRSIWARKKRSVKALGIDIDRKAQIALELELAHPLGKGGLQRRAFVGFD